VRLVGY